MSKYGYVGKESDIPQQAFKSNAGVLNVNDHLALSQENKLTQYGQLELIQTQAFSGVSEVDFTSIQESTYNVHFMTLNNIQHTAGLDITGVQFYESGVLETGSVYQYGHQYNEAGGSNGELKAQSSTYIYWSYNNNGTTQDARDSENGYIYFYNLGDSTKYSFTTHQELFNDGGAIKMSFGSGVLPQTSVVDGIRLKMISGNNSSGTASLYGIREYS
tara:strand:+ start:346 stop:996 length:651 start_codon:yes stop_codon:yes gene_type:complete